MKHAYQKTFLPQVAMVAVGALALVGATTVRLSPTSPPAISLAKPYELPTDVFDLAYFNQYRRDGRLDFPAAETALENLSDRDLVAAQNLFDETAWRAFVALNWAAKPDGSPDPSKGYDNDTAPKVWEFWKQTSDVFLPNGAKPAPWGGQSRRVADSFKSSWRQSTTANEGLQAFSGPLVDQNGRWLHYTALLNKEDYDYVVTNELYNLEGQAAYVQRHRIDFPLNDDTRHGAIELKLAWKILTPAEVKSGRFLVRRLPVVPYKPAGTLMAMARPSHAPSQLVPRAHLTGKSNGNEAPDAAPQAGGVEETVGLVGMHIAMRTRSSPQWIWATFEQIDNTRLDPHTGSAKHPLPSRPSLSNPNNPSALVEANILPAFNAAGVNGQPPTDWDETSQTNPIPPVEVLRLVPPPPSTAAINALMQDFLGSKNSVLRFYELVGTQWPTHPLAPAVPGGNNSAPESIVRKMPGQVVPVYLTNSTMETYFQHGYQSAGPLEQDDRGALDIDNTMVFGTESCAGCHYSAGVCLGFRKNSAGKLLRDNNGQKVPIFGENSNDGLTGNGNYSWMLQIEAKSKDPKQ